MQQLFPSIFEDQLSACYNISISDLERLGGYSNFSFKVRDNKGELYVAKIAPHHKDALHLSKEEYVLSWLQHLNYYKSPRIVKTQENHNSIVIEEGESIFKLQLYHFLPGEPKCAWFEKCSKEDIITIFSELANLHCYMAQIPLSRAIIGDFKINEIPTEFSKVIEKQPISHYLLKHKNKFFTQTKKIINESKAYLFLEVGRQLIHGDIHLENILFFGNSLTGFLDFECTHYAPLELDIIFSALRVSKFGKSDDRLQYDNEGISAGLNAYAIFNEKFSYLLDKYQKHEQLWKALFCLDQSLLYLNQASKGIWTLEEGIGFLPCFNGVLEYE